MGSGGIDRSSSWPGSPSNRSLDAFVVALHQTCDGGRWYTSTKELQLASLDFCTACRSVTILGLRVYDDIPPRLLAAADAPPQRQNLSDSSRLPRLRARRVFWNSTTAAELRKSVYAIADATYMYLCGGFVDSLEGVVWPRRLKKLEFDMDSQFDRALDGVAWPASLEQLEFGGDFDQPISGVTWPPSLRKLTFGNDFDQSVDQTRWPTNLLRIEFGRHFNQPIKAVTWPDSVTQLWFGTYFNQPIVKVRWPASLQKLTFEREFNHPIDEVVWPASLEQLTFGDCFNQPIHGVSWPNSVRRLSFGRILEDAYFYQDTDDNGFDQPISGIVWPTSLQRLAFGDSFNQPIRAVTWPDSITQLSFGRAFNRPIDAVTWPASLCDLCFGALYEDMDNGIFLISAFKQAIGGARWPATMRRLTLGGKFRHSLNGLGAWMPNLEELCLLPGKRSAYGSLLLGINWPNTLQTLTVYCGSGILPERVPQSVEVEFHTMIRDVLRVYKVKEHGVHEARESASGPSK